MKKTASQIAIQVLEKLAGYFQNVVGFDDPTLLEALRKSGPNYVEDPKVRRKYYEAVGDYWKGVEKKLNPTRYEGEFEEKLKDYTLKNPPPPRMDPSGRPKLLKGTDLGYLGKYVVVPELYPYAKKDPYSGASTGKGYLSKEKLLKRVLGISGGTKDDEQARVFEQIKQSPHKFFTTTSIE